MRSLDGRTFATTIPRWQCHARWIHVARARAHHAMFVVHALAASHA